MTASAQIISLHDSADRVLQRTCCKCGVEKSLDNFYKSKLEKTGHNFMCKSCHTGWHRDRMKDKKWREKRYKDRNESYKKNPMQRVAAYSRFIQKKYGVTYEYVTQVLKDQFGLCANRGCGTEVTFDARVGSKTRAVVDHDHKTGKFRGVLCNRCNILAGQIESDTNRTLGITEYLNKNKHIGA